MTVRIDPVQAGQSRTETLGVKLARSVLRPLVSYLAGRLLLLARRLDPVDAAELPPPSAAQKTLVREVLLLPGWSRAVEEVDLPRFAGELADSGLRRRILQDADVVQLGAELAEDGVRKRILQEANVAQLGAELAETGLRRRILQEADPGQVATEVTELGLRRRILEQAELGELATELEETGALDRIARGPEVAGFAVQLARTGLLRRVLEAGDAALLATELMESRFLARGSVEQRTALIAAAVQAPATLQAKWPVMDEILNFSSRMRNDWMAKQAAQLPAGCRLLDAGAGQGQYRSLFGHTHYESQDFAQYAGSEDAIAPETWEYVKLDYVCDITAIPVPDATFGAVVCTEVLEHVPDPLAALRELARVTKPGGTLLLSAPLGSGMHQEPYHFYGGFSRHFWLKVLPELGFTVDEVVPLGGLMSHVAQEVHRASRYMAAEGRLAPEQAWVLQEWLPRMLYEEDEAVFVEQFTVGYVVRATKRAAAAGGAP